jgi:hypothetical protein
VDVFAGSVGRRVAATAAAAGTRVDVATDATVSVGTAERGAIPSNRPSVRAAATPPPTSTNTITSQLRQPKPDRPAAVLV